MNKIHGIQGLADCLGVSVVTAQRLKDRSLFPCYRTGRKVFFIESEILDGLRTEGVPSCRVKEGGRKSSAKGVRSVPPHKPR